MPLLIPVLVVAGIAGAAGLSGGGYFLAKFIGSRVENNIDKIHKYTKNAVDGVKSDIMVIANDVMEFLTTEVWPRVLTIFRILQTYVLMLIISHCDVYLKAMPRSSYETIFAKVICYSCWIYVAYFLFKVLLDDILSRVKKVPEASVLVAILVVIFGVLLRVFKDHFQDYIFSTWMSWLSTRIDDIITNYIK